MMQDRYKWEVQLKGHPFDIEDITDQFPGTTYQIKSNGGSPCLSSPEFEALTDPVEVRAEAADLVSRLNAAAALCDPNFYYVKVDSVFRLCEDGSYEATVFGHGQPSVRMKSKAKPRGTSREIEMLKLIDKDDAFRRAAADLTTRPVTWFNLSLVYDTIKKKLSGKEQSDHKPLVARGWLTEDEAERFYRTMQGHRHGHPRRLTDTMDLKEAEPLMRRVFGKFADELIRGAP